MTDRKTDPFAGLAELGSAAPPVQAAFAIGTLTALAPLTVVMGDQTYYDDEIVLTRHLTERTEEVTIEWPTQPATCTATHSHVTQGRYPMIIHSPLRAGQRLLLLPTTDQQMVYAVDILP